jgi:hypothetical protein
MSETFQIETLSTYTIDIHFIILGIIFTREITFTWGITFTLGIDFTHYEFFLKPQSL